MLPVLGLAAGSLLMFSREENVTAVPHVETDLTVPVDLVTRKQWVDFIRIFINGNPRTITPAFRLGTFEMTVRRLVDLGAMVDPETTKYKGRRVWSATWKNPANLKTFLDDPLIQYGLFAESINRYANDDKVRNAIDSEIDGNKLTLSGALAVAHRAGLPGFAHWIQDPKDRQRFKDNTTSFFQRSNGLF